MIYKIRFLHTHAVSSQKRISDEVIEHVKAKSPDEAWEKVGEKYCYHAPPATNISILEIWKVDGKSTTPVNIPGLFPSNPYDAALQDNADRDRVADMIRQENLRKDLSR